MKYLIHAYEGMYQGTGGMYDVQIVDCNNVDMLYDMAYEASIDVMKSYYGIDEDLRASAEEQVEFGDNFEEALNREYEENVAYAIYRLNAEAQAMSVDALEDEYNKINDLDDFLEMYMDEQI